MNADFTSALFLGLRHRGVGAAQAPLTTGRPAVLGESGLHHRVAGTLAAAQGAGAGLLERTSLHALVDVLTGAGRAGTILLDRASYPIGGWAAAIAGAHGATVLTFRHHDAADAQRVLRTRGLRRPVALLTDGWCAGCLRPAPLRQLAAVASGQEAHLVVDDSLGAGVLGRRAAPGCGFGVGGAGTPAWCGLPGTALVWVASTAKAYGAPLAVVTGARSLVTRIGREGPARMHASPPTACDVQALASAWSDPTLTARRKRLEALVTRVRAGCRSRGPAEPQGEPFPMVALPMPTDQALWSWQHLRRHGVAALATRSRCTGYTCLTVCLRADHRDDEIDQLLEALATSRGRWA